MFKPVALVFCISIAGTVPAVAQENMPAPELVKYVRDAWKMGLKDTQIQHNAEAAGWPTPAVKDAIEYVHGPGRASAKVDQRAGAQPVNPADQASAPDTAAPRQSAPAETKTIAPVAAETKTVAPAAEAKTTAPPAADGTSASQPSAFRETTVAETKTTAPSAGGTPAAATPAPAKPAFVNRGVPDEYQIGGGDVISINVWGEPAASVPGVMVRPDGKISMPLVKEVFVAGMTPTELERVITEQLSDKIKAADVTVVVNQINSKKVFMAGGGSKREGPLAFSYGMTVMQAISESGGLSDYAKRKKIYVLRNENGRQFKLPFDYDAVLRGEHMETNIPLVAGDIVVVPNH